MQLKPHEIKIISYLLEIASDEFSNHGCNDIDAKFFNSIPREQWIEMDKDEHFWNGDPEEHDPERINPTDWSLMSYFSKRILDLLKKPDDAKV